MTTTYTSSNPKILGGKLVIKGTRIPVARIIQLLSEGYMAENIAEQYPQLDIITLRHVINEIIGILDKSNRAPHTL